LHRVEVVGPVSSTLYGFYTVSAAIALSPASGLAGTSVTSTITGFPANEPISIRWYVTSSTNTVIASASASTTGSASVSFAVPSDAAVGDHKVEAVGNVSSRRVSAQFAVESSGPPPPVDPTCKLDRSSGPVGAALVVTCANFAASENINIYWDDTNSTRKSRIWSGTARGGSSTIFVPDATAGDHMVIALGATSANRVEQTFTVVPSLKLSATTSKVGTFVSATLKGFGPGESVALSWDGGAALARVAVSAVGSGSVSFPVPEATKGQHLVGTTGETSALQASTPLSVEPSLTLSPASGYVGSNSAITLRGFSGNESVTILWYGGSTGTTALATVAVDGRGSGSVGLTIPSATKGNHRVEGSGDAASIASASFTVLPRLTLSATTGTVGTTVQAGLTGFGESEQIRLEWFDTTTASSVLTFVTASADGATTANIVIPDASNGSHKFMATGTTTGASSYLFFVVKAGLTLSPGNGAPGASVTVSLTGYRAGETVNVAWFSTATKSSVVASGVASAFGSSTATFTVPTDASIGDHKVEGTGQPSVARASAVFTVRQGGPSGASTSIQTDKPSVDMPIGEDFSQKSADGLPVGWSIARGGSEFVAIKLKGEGESARLNVTGPADVDDLWLIRDGVKFTQPDVRVKLHFSKSGAAGVVLAWNGPQDYIAVVADPESDQVDVIEVVNASVRTSFATRDGILDVDRGRDYWLRAESGVNGAGDTWISLYWSTDGENFELVGVAEGLSKLYGMVGITMVGSETTNVDFDDFVARPSHATEPAVVEQPQAHPTSTPVPTETESPSEESTPTQQPAQSPEPAPSEVPTDTPTAQPAATETPVPSPTATIEPTLEPTVGEAPPPEPTSDPTVEDESEPE